MMMMFDKIDDLLLQACKDDPGIFIGGGGGGQKNYVHARKLTSAKPKVLYGWVQVKSPWSSRWGIDALLCYLSLLSILLQNGI